MIVFVRKYNYVFNNKIYNYMMFELKGLSLVKITYKLFLFDDF